MYINDIQVQDIDTTRIMNNYCPLTTFYLNETVICYHEYVNMAESRTDSYVVYPNPSKDKLFFKTGHNVIDKNTRFKIYDYTGGIVKVGDMDFGIQQGIPIEELPSGAYILFIEVEGRKFSKRFIKL